VNAFEVLLLDHEDSFSFLLGDQFAARGCEVAVVRARMSLAALERRLRERPPALVVLSPGPGRPADAGVTLEWLRTRPRVPVFGVCLGHQAIAEAAGAAIVRAPSPRHGEATTIELLGAAPFGGLPRMQVVGRYHSLVATELPASLEVVARTRDEGPEIVMAIRNRELPQLGVQFHPESLLTPRGADWIDAVVAWARECATVATETSVAAEAAS
jgi:anthranilate synthase component 2